ncbi:MAG TPA: PilZ domain-containing protein [Oscillospiraceae bacterium]|nr:PilZ domain-containing protein [Oscillospiraceae bacterium]
MFSKEKVLKVDVMDREGKKLFSTETFDFPKTIRKKENGALLILKGKDLPEIARGDEVSIVFLMHNNDRVKYTTRVSISTTRQFNILIGNQPELLEDRRRFYKINTNLPAIITFYTVGEETTKLEEPLKVLIKDLNIGGVAILTTSDFVVGTEIMLILNINNNELELCADILRKQESDDNSFTYGCRFLKTTLAQEEILAQYVFTQQIANRYK